MAVWNSNSRRGQAGFSLIDMLLAIVIGSMIAATAASGLYTVIHVSSASNESFAESNAAFLTSSRFASDVASVGPTAGVNELISSGEPGCGGEESILRLIGPGKPDFALRRMAADVQQAGVQDGETDDSAAEAIRVRSYRVVKTDDGAYLRRSTCSGSTLEAALSGVETAAPVVRDLVNDGPEPVVVTCNGQSEFSRCRVIEMSVRTTAYRYFTVRGTVGSVLSPTPTTTPTLAVAPPTGTCTILATETTWGATGGYAGGNGDLHAGETTIYTYNDTNRRNSFLRFDLTQPCVGTGDSWRTLPGGRNLTAVALKLAYLGKNNAACGIFPGISKDEQIMQPLGADSPWSEATLKGNNMPGGVRTGNDFKFNVANQGTLTTHTGAGLTAAVKSWYAAGGWVNNGWVVRRDGAGDTCGKSNMFASRSHADPNLRPRLEITWGP